MCSVSLLVQLLKIWTWTLSKLLDFTSSIIQNIKMSCTNLRMSQTLSLISVNVLRIVEETCVGLPPNGLLQKSLLERYNLTHEVLQYLGIPVARATTMFLYDSGQVKSSQTVSTACNQRTCNSWVSSGKMYESCRTEHQPPCDNSLCLRTYRQNEVLEEVLWVGPWYPDTSWKPYPATPAGSSKWEWISKTQKFTLDYQVFLGFRL